MLSLLTTLAQSELKYVNKKFVCDDTSVLMDELVNGEYNEKPIWRGIDSETKTIYGVLMNSKTGTWTIIQFDGKINTRIQECQATLNHQLQFSIIQRNIGIIGCHPESLQYWYEKPWQYINKHWHKGEHHKLLLEFVDELMMSQ
jgi:hypothetical protein